MVGRLTENDKKKIIDEIKEKYKKSSTDCEDPKKKVLEIIADIRKLERILE